MENIGEIRNYHEDSKHFRDKLTGPRVLEHANEPEKVKDYPGAPLVRLPASLNLESSLAGVIEGRRWHPCPVVGSAELATLLRLSYGVTRVRREFAYRAAPSAGALYPVELYLCCGDLHGLEAGIYYFNPPRDCLMRIVDGDFRKPLSEALSKGGRERWHEAYLVLTALPWRSSWKYGLRAYRYCLLDTGHLAGNILTVGTALGLSPMLVSQMREESLNSLLGLDGKSEFPLAVVPLVPTDEPPAPPPAEPAPRIARQLPSRPVMEPAIVAAHNAGRWSGGSPAISFPPRLQPPVEGIDLQSGQLSGGPIDKLIERRRSYRGSARATLKKRDFAAYLDIVSWAYPADWMPEGLASNPLTEIFIFNLDVEEMEAGIYRYNAVQSKLTPLPLPIDRDLLTASCMGQRFVARANVFIVIALDLNRLAHAGVYRIKGLDAGIVGQMAYLAAGALGGGCCGVGAFFDDELSRLLGFDGRDRTVLYGLTLAMR